MTRRKILPTKPDAGVEGERAADREVPANWTRIPVDDIDDDSRAAFCCWRTESALGAYVADAAVDDNYDDAVAAAAAAAVDGIDD